MTEKADLIVWGATEVVTCDPALGAGPTGVIVNGAVAVKGEKVIWVGPQSELSSKVAIAGNTKEVDAAGKAVIPGFVDAHTHLVFAGERRDEFAARATGSPYEAGGILRTVRETNSARDDELCAFAKVRADQMLVHGTTTAEAKSGYSLSVEGEKRLLEVLVRVAGEHAMDLEITFLGAHAVPQEFDGRADDFVEMVVNEMTPECAPLAKWCDVFCDEGAFTVEQSRRVLQAGSKAGLAPRIHANELASSGGAVLAAEVGAASADHLLYLDESEAKGLAGAGCVGVVCPVTALSLGKFPDVQLMRDAGMTVALASDLNPGMAPSGNLQFAISIATRAMRMSQEDALIAATAGGAAALRRDDIGRIAVGCLADLLVLSSDSALDLGYNAGINLVEKVIKRGSPVEKTRG